MSQRNRHVLEARKRLDEVREALALKVFKIDRVMQLVGSAIERGEARVGIDQEGSAVQLRHTRAAAALIGHLAKLGYCGAWVEVASLDPRRENYHELVVGIEEGDRLEKAARLLGSEGTKAAAVPSVGGDWLRQVEGQRPVMVPPRQV